MKRPHISRAAAMTARPVQAPPVKTERKNDKLYVTVQFERPGWQRILGADRFCRRTFGLDAYGEEVYAACNGRTTVKYIVKTFSKTHHLSIQEASLSVTKFMKTLMVKGLVGMELPLER